VKETLLTPGGPERNDIPMNYWLMKSEPDAFSWSQLVKQGRAEWDGVRNHAAQLNMKAMRTGDRALFYHSNIGLECVGIMEIVREAGPDSTDDSGKWIAVEVAPVEPLAAPVTLRTIKADPVLSAMAMVRQSRLSVSPVTSEEFDRIMMLSKS
jgi:predicted RNA-binding protein with PUA-like domain